MSPTITGAERDALYNRIVVRLDGIDDVYRAVEEENWELAQELAQEFSDLLRLLFVDLGWGEKAEQSLALHTPHDVLKRAADSLRELARSDRALYEDQRASVQERVDEALYLEQICERLMEQCPDQDR